MNTHEAISGHTYAEVQGSTPPAYAHIPETRPQNHKEALWTSREWKPCPNALESSKTPMEAMLESFSKWTEKGETLASNIWMNLNTGQSVSDAAWGKLRLAARALARGGFEPLFKRRFSTDPSEKLKKTYACYLSTSAGPVAGTLYISTVKIAFCSDRRLIFTVPFEEKARGYYKFAIPFASVRAVNPSFRQENPAEKYIQIIAMDDHEFWLMGLVNYGKALSKLQESVPCQAQQHQPPVEWITE